MDIPAPRSRGRRGGLQGFFPGQSTTAAAVDIPVPRGVFKVSSQAKVQLPLLLTLLMQGFFALFPWKKVQRSPAR